MRRFLPRRAAALTSVLATALLCLVAPAAWADGSLNGGTAVLWNGCRDYATHYSVSHPGASSWDITVTASDPQGSETDQYYVAGSDDAASGTQPITLCGDENPGWYTLRAEVTYYDTMGDYLDSEVLSGSMHLTRMPTRTGLTVRSRGGEQLAVKVRSSERRYSGWSRDHEGYTAVYARCGSHGWERVWGTRHVTDHRGQVVHRLQLQGLRTRVAGHDRTCHVKAIQARTLPTYRTEASWSPTLTVRHGRLVLHPHTGQGRPSSAR